MSVRVSNSREYRNGPSLKLLIIRSQAGDGAAFSDLMRRYQRMIWTYICVNVQDSHLADDIAQETFVDAFRKLRSLRAPEAFPRWVRSIARTHIDRYLRRKAPDFVEYSDEVAYEPGAPQPHAVFQYEADLARVQALLRVLPAGQREAASLRYVDGCSTGQIAEFLGIG